jgi:hypothetical protein
VETTYADLRATDLVVDHGGKQWPTTELDTGEAVTFWLLDPASKIRMYYLTKLPGDTVTVARIRLQADEATELEQQFPSDVAAVGVTMVEAVAAAAEIAEPAVEYTQREHDAAVEATEENPVSLPPFPDMTPLEQRSHLYLLHGVFAFDLKSRDELNDMHNEAHRLHAAGELNAQHIPHTHKAA